MKVLHSILIVFVVFVGCKQIPKTNTVIAKEVNKSATESQLEKEENNAQKTTKNKELTIEEFLQQLQTAVKNNNSVIIEKSLKFPFEFQSGGESFFYDNYEDFKQSESVEFLTILEAKFIGKDDFLYKVRYQDPESIDYFVTFYIIKIDNEFKLKSFAEPH